MSAIKLRRLFVALFGAVALGVGAPALVHAAGTTTDRQATVQSSADATPTPTATATVAPSTKATADKAPSVSASAPVGKATPAPTSTLSAKATASASASAPTIPSASPTAAPTATATATSSAKATVTPSTKAAAKVATATVASAPVLTGPDASGNFSLAGTAVTPSDLPAGQLVQAFLEVDGTVVNSQSVLQAGDPYVLTGKVTTTSLVRVFLSVDYPGYTYMDWPTGNKTVFEQTIAPAPASATNELVYSPNFACTYEPEDVLTDGTIIPAGMQLTAIPSFYNPTDQPLTATLDYYGLNSQVVQPHQTYSYATLLLAAGENLQGHVITQAEIDACVASPTTNPIDVPDAPSIIDDSAIEGDAHYGPTTDSPGHYAWTLNPDGSLTVTALGNNVFPSGKSYTYPAPVDKYEQNSNNGSGDGNNGQNGGGNDSGTGNDQGSGNDSGTGNTVSHTGDVTSNTTGKLPPSTVSADATGWLAHTGGPTAWIGGLGAAFAVLGGAVLVWRRRRFNNN